LTNGDRLTCNIKELADGKLTLRVGYAGDATLTINWTMVSSLSSEGELRMELDDGKHLVVKVQPAKQAGQVVALGSAAPLTLSRVVTLKPADSKESWTDNLSSRADFGWGYTGSNGLNTLSLTTQNFYWGEKWEAAFLGSENWNGQRGQPNSPDQILGQTNVNRYLTQHLFLFPCALGLHVTQGNGNRGSTWQFGAGAGWSFLRKKDNHFAVFGGIVQLGNTGALVMPTLEGQSQRESLRTESPAFLGSTRWVKTTENGITWMIQGLYVHPTTVNVRDQAGFRANFSIPIHGPLTFNVNVQDVTTPLKTVTLGLSGLTMSTGLGLHF
jgi:hypothetical protein